METALAMNTWVKQIAVCTLVLAVGTLLPAVADACPHCAAQNSGGGNGFLWLLASMILLPYPVVGFAVYWIRQTDQEE